MQVDQKRNVFRGYTISSADPSVEPLEVTVKLDKRGESETTRGPDLTDLLENMVGKASVALGVETFSEIDDH